MASSRGCRSCFGLMARILVTEEIADGGLDRPAGRRARGRRPARPDARGAARRRRRAPHALIIRSATQVTAEVLEAGRRPAGGRPGRHRPRQRRRRRRHPARASWWSTRRSPTSSRPPSTPWRCCWPRPATSPRPTPRSRPGGGSARSGRASSWTTRRSASSASAASASSWPSGPRPSACGWSPTTPSSAPSGPGRWASSCCRLEQLVAEADFLTIHLPKTPETIGLIGKELLAQAKPSLRIINVARGGIVDEEALAEAVREGIVAGAALDVFATEPTTESPLFELDSVVVTPHLGASTREAQDKAGDTIAEMVQLALAGEFVPFAVNVSAAEASETVRPFLPLAERLGPAVRRRWPRACRRRVEVVLRGPDRRLRHPHPHPVAAEGPVRRRQRGAGDLRERADSWPRSTASRSARSTCATPVDYVNLITIRGGGHEIAGTLGRPAGRGPHRRSSTTTRLDVPPADHMLVVRNDDRPGHDRRRRHGARRGRGQHRRHGRRAGRPRRARRSWCWPRPSRCRPSLIEELRRDARDHLGAPPVGGLGRSGGPAATAALLSSARSTLAAERQRHDRARPLRPTATGRRRRCRRRGRARWRPARRGRSAAPPNTDQPDERHHLVRQPGHRRAPRATAAPDEPPAGQHDGAEQPGGDPVALDLVGVVGGGGPVAASAARGGTPRSPGTGRRCRSRRAGRRPRTGRRGSLGTPPTAGRWRRSPGARRPAGARARRPSPRGRDGAAAVAGGAKRRATARGEPKRAIAWASASSGARPAATPSAVASRRCSSVSARTRRTSVARPRSSSSSWSR